MLTSWLVQGNDPRALNLASLLTKQVNEKSSVFLLSFWGDGDSGTYSQEKEMNGPAEMKDKLGSSSPSPRSRIALPLLNNQTKGIKDASKRIRNSSSSSTSNNSSDVLDSHRKAKLYGRRELKIDEKGNNLPWFVNETWRNPDEVHHVVFVKVHKAASTTVFNGFIRFAMSRDLNVMFPNRSWILSQKNPGLGKLAPHPKSPPFLFDILCNHVLFNHKLVKPYFPLDTQYVGIVRDPWEQVKSAFNYYTDVFRAPYLKNAASFKDFILRQPELEPSNPLSSYTNNRMSLDLGLPPDEVTNASYVKPFVRHLDDVFDLMLLADRFDESMVLLRRTFRWTMKDVVFLKLNSHKAKVKDYFQPDAQTTRRFEQFAKFDVAVFRYFEKVFHKKIAAGGNDFFDELQIFTKLVQQVSEFCNKAQSHVGSLVAPANKWSKEFSIRRAECKILKVPEPTLNRVIRNQQLARLCPHKSVCVKNWG
ncbi:galactose-3-O-sulfotransferase 2-like isoform X2 [Littorina saxatilis]|uniref:galactose-3-O-sulfotransferase 2-like isoform X2 n=1 Tax=Littorina saxatilis TaxID=31220 RepID=UPI0038B4A475